ncbi:type IV toxin-antitoxin system AbiEi family antitoxin domain-containing protein [Kushneria sp. EE4]
MALPIEEAVSRWLIDDYQKGAISNKRLQEEIASLYKKEMYKGERILNIKTKTPGNEQFRRCISRLEISGVIDYPGMKLLDPLSFRYLIVKPFSKASTEELLCSIYNYGYISHLSAMAWYGVTDRIPKLIYFTTCSQKMWKEKSLSEITERIGSLSVAKNFMPVFPISGEHFGKEVIVISTSNYLVPRENERGVRVRDIGNLFLDMLKNPNRCGGESHVISVFFEHAEIFQRQIIKAADKYGTAIDQARVGFFFEKVLEKDIPIIKKWKDSKSNQRGSSRLFIANGEFHSHYDSEWNLSINNKDLYGFAENGSRLG